MQNVIMIMAFISVALLTESVLQVLRNRKLQAPQKIRKRLAAVLRESEENFETDTSLLKTRLMNDFPGLNSILSKFRFSKAIENFLIHSGSDCSVGRFILISVGLGAAAFTGVHFFLLKGIGISLGAAALTGYLPTLHFRSLKGKRVRAFEEQLPEVLDLMSRGMRAGHSITTAIQFAAEESPDPIGPEFKQVFDEVTFGMDLPVALQNLAKRIDCPDLRFMITAITIQRDVGGNLSDLFDRLGDLMRKRVVLIRQTQSLTAQGRISGQILIALPLLMAGYLFMANPDYLALLFEDPLGVKMAVGASILMLLGHLTIKKIVAIDTL